LKVSHAAFGTSMSCRIIFSKSQRLYRIGQVDAFYAEETTYQTSRTATLSAAGTEM
jgi:hypothetical protein